MHVIAIRADDVTRRVTMRYVCAFDYMQRQRDVIMRAICCAPVRDTRHSSARYYALYALRRLMILHAATLLIRRALLLRLHYVDAAMRPLALLVTRADMPPSLQMPVLPPLLRYDAFMLFYRLRYAYAIYAATLITPCRRVARERAACA